jgi:hypothetical protein
VAVVTVVTVGMIGCGSVTSANNPDAAAGGASGAAGVGGGAAGAGSGGAGGAAGAGTGGAAGRGGAGGAGGAAGVGGISGAGGAAGVGGISGAGGVAGVGGISGGAGASGAQGGSGGAGTGGQNGGSGGAGAGGSPGAGGAATDGGVDQIGDAGTPSDGPQTSAVTAVSLDDITAFAAASGTPTKVPYIKKLYDDRSEYDVSNSRFTATDAGDYEFCASLTSGTYTGAFRLRLYVNGQSLVAFAVDAAGAGVEHGCRVVRLAAGDYVEVFVLQSSGAAVMFAQNVYWNWMTVAKVSATLDLTTITPFQAATGGFTVVPYATPRYDDKSQFDASRSRFTAAQAGDYLFCASLSASNDTTDPFDLVLFVNGVREDALAGDANLVGGQGCRPVRLAAGNYVQVEVFQASGGPMAFTADAATNWMTVALMPSTLSLNNAAMVIGAAASFTKIQYGTELYDDQNQYDATMSRFTAAQAGDYQFCASLLSDEVSFELDLYINGNRDNAFAGGPGSGGTSHGCRVVRLATGNHVEISAYSAGTPIYETNGEWDWLTVSKVR